MAKINGITELEHEFQVQRILREKIQNAYSRHALLEAEFKKKKIQYASAIREEIASGKIKKLTPTEQKAEVEYRMSFEETYAEYLSLPTTLEGIYRELKLAELRLRILEKYLDRSKYSSRL